MCMYCLYISLFTFYMGHVNPERWVEGKGWEMHCQPAEHETLCVSWFENMESFLPPQSCWFSAKSRLSWTNLLLNQINNNLPTSVSSLPPFTLTILWAWKHLPWDVHEAGSLHSFRTLQVVPNQRGLCRPHLLNKVASFSCPFPSFTFPSTA